MGDRPRVVLLQERVSEVGPGVVVQAGACPAAVLGLVRFPLTKIGRTLITHSVDTFSVSLSRGWVLALSPMRTLRIINYMGCVHYPLAHAGRTIITRTVYAFGVSPCGGWVLLMLSPTRTLRVNTIPGVPWCARCAQSCVEPLFIGSPGMLSPEGSEAVPVCLRAAFSQIPSNTVTFTGVMAGGGTMASSGHRVLLRVGIHFTCKVFEGPPTTARRPLAACLKLVPNLPGLLADGPRPRKAPPLRRDSSGLAQHTWGDVLLQPFAVPLVPYPFPVQRLKSAVSIFGGFGLRTLGSARLLPGPDPVVPTAKEKG
ncbi:hypothetical protein B0H19DRAFT_1084064 [Mycena capillaripes]|nr:hypothetical protein B0H19DRAFT_1084064 [Mycena capillaripes]